MNPILFINLLIDKESTYLIFHNFPVVQVIDINSEERKK